MATVTLKGSVTSGTGPFEYKFEAINPCVDITFTDEDGNTGVNEIIVGDDNPYVEVTAEFDETLCSTDDVLSLFRITVTSSTDATCTSIAEVNKDNPCRNFTATIISTQVANMQQTLTVSLVSGNGPFTYVWEIRSGNITLDDQGNGVAIINRSDETAAIIRVTVTDANGCSATNDISLPAVGEAPVLQSATRRLVCAETSILIDVVALGSDADGSLDLNTLTIVTNPTQGVAVVNTTTGIVTYTPNGGATGTDSLTLQIQDNNGNLSNSSYIELIITPCSEGPVAMVDNVTTDCDTSVVIDPTLNDTDSDGVVIADSLEILTAPLHGTAVVGPGGQITYTPDRLYDGTDLIRYIVYDNDGNQSGIGIINITVNTCCDVHSIDFTVDCSLVGDVVTFSAVNSGAASNVLTDTTEVDIGGGYAAGASQVLSYTCGPVANIFTNQFTSGAGVWATGAAGSLIQTELAPNFHRVQIVFENAIDSLHAIEFLNWYNNALVQVIRFSIDSGAPVPDYSFLKSNITNFTVSTTQIQFNYQVAAYSGICQTDIAGEVNFTHTALGGTVTNANFELVSVTSLLYGDPDHQINFRRTVTRTGCPDIVVEKNIQVREIWNLCDPSAYIITTLQAGGGMSANSSPAAYDVSVSTAGATSIGDIQVGGVNILTQSYLLNSSGVTALETALDTYLAANGGGDATVLLSNTTLIIQVTGSTLTWQTITLDNLTVGTFTTVD